MASTSRIPLASTRSPLQTARSHSPSLCPLPSESGPLVYETEDDLLRVLDELREGLRENVRAKWEKSERKCSLEEVEELVLKVSFTSTRSYLTTAFWRLGAAEELWTGCYMNSAPLGAMTGMRIGQLGAKHSPNNKQQLH